MRYLPLLLACLLLTGCSVQDPTDKPQSVPNAEAPTPPAPAGNTAATTSQLRLAGRRPGRSPEAAARAYGELAMNFADDYTPRALERALSLSSHSNAQQTVNFFNDALKARETGTTFPGGSIVAVAPQAEAGKGALYVIARRGDYTSDGDPVGPTTIKVFSVLATPHRGGWVIDKWTAAQ